MAGNIPRNPTSLYLLSGGLAGDDHVLAQVEPRMFEGPQALYDALWPSYNAARENNIPVLASMESKHLTYDLSVMELMDVCRAAYDSSDGEEDQEDENDPTCVCLEVKVGKKIHTMAKIDPAEFEGAEALEAEVLSQCENIYGQYDPLFVTFLKKSKISKFVNDEASRASVRGICRSAYPVN